MNECVGARQTREKNTNRMEHKWSMKAMRMSERTHTHTASVDIGLCALDRMSASGNACCLLFCFCYFSWPVEMVKSNQLGCAKHLADSIISAKSIGTNTHVYTSIYMFRSCLFQFTFPSHALRHLLCRSKQFLQTMKQIGIWFMV